MQKNTVFHVWLFSLYEVNFELKLIPMKNVTLALAFLLCVNIASAQPAFQANNCFHAGIASAIGLSYIGTPFVNETTNTSGNHTWDYSNNPWQTPTYTYVFQPGSASVYVAFQNMQINEYSAIGLFVDKCYHYSADNDTLYFDALEYAGNAYIAHPSVPYLTFPMQFSDSIYSHNQIFTNPSFPTYATGSTTRSWKYDGYGTVLLPYGSQDNCYRISTHQVDSTYITGGANVYDEITWYRASDGLPVLKFQNQGGIIAAQYCLVDGTSSVTSLPALSAQTFYPNPARVMIQFSTREKQWISIYSANGQLVERAQVAGQMSIAHLAAGSYFIISEENKSGSPLVIER
jgi:Secretion system C-terminal sorting domain